MSISFSLQRQKCSERREKSLEVKVCSLQVIFLKEIDFCVLEKTSILNISSHCKCADSFVVESAEGRYIEKVKCRK